ncbi:MAG TPA: hydroxymethylglutaryl-CoA lyase [Bacteroidia bacterium]|nr:hydroxymethylglutaryl-CoA lyase [Bacteroidia bacterium]
MLKITECPRDAMQGIKDMIPTEKKLEYLRQLLKVGLHRLDFGSFVSPKAIPQMQDTRLVLENLDPGTTGTSLLAIIANQRGAEEACTYPQIRFLGFPFSISETFQRRNTNSGITESLDRVKAIQDLCAKHDKNLLVYISMAFGNPYGDAWGPDLVMDWCHRLANLGIRHMALADTIGSSEPANISLLFSRLLPELPQVELGAHLHSTKEKALEKIKSAYASGCRNFDVAIHGFGGCPMASEELTGNIATEQLLAFAEEEKLKLGLNSSELQKAYSLSWNIFNTYH